MSLQEQINGLRIGILILTFGYGITFVLLATKMTTDINHLNQKVQKLESKEEKSSDGPDKLVDSEYLIFSTSYMEGK